MTYEELNNLIDNWLAKNISEIKADPEDSRTRNAAKVGFFSAVLIAMTPQEREKIAKEFNLKSKDEPQEQQSGVGNTDDAA